MVELPNPENVASNTRILTEGFEQSSEAFGKSVRLNTQNKADLASHYAYTPERYRVYVDGVRQLIQYDGEPTQFTNNADSFSLEPQTSGEVVTLKTAERYRYVVQFVLEWSIAFQINQELQSGDVWAIGYGDPDLENGADDTPGPNADGWFVYQNKSNAVDKATLAEYRNGTEVAATTVSFSELPLTWGRLAGDTNWYNVGETSLTETYVEKSNGNTEQRNDKVATVGVDQGKGPELANHRFTASVKAGSGAGSLELETGSIGVRIFGDVSTILRTKTFDFELEYTGTTGEFEPLLAIRVDPDRSEVTSQLRVLEAVAFGGDSNLVMIANNFDSENVLDTNGDPLTDADFSAPVELNELNSVTETSTAVEQVPDGSGTAQTSMVNPGGYQVGYASLTTADAQGNTVSQASTSNARTQKRIIPDGDIAVVMLRSGATGTVEGNIQFDQDW